MPQNSLTLYYWGFLIFGILLCTWLARNVVMGFFVWGFKSKKNLVTSLKEISESYTTFNSTQLCLELSEETDAFLSPKCSQRRLCFSQGISGFSLQESFTSKFTQSSKSCTGASQVDSLGKNVKKDMLLTAILLQQEWNLNRVDEDLSKCRHSPIVPAHYLLLLRSCNKLDAITSLPMHLQFRGLIAVIRDFVRRRATYITCKMFWRELWAKV